MIIYCERYGTYYVPYKSKRAIKKVHMNRYCDRDEAVAIAMKLNPSKSKKKRRQDRAFLEEGNLPWKEEPTVRPAFHEEPAFQEEPVDINSAYYAGLIAEGLEIALLF